MTDTASKKEPGPANPDTAPGLSPPPKYDADWRERIEIARQARDDARKARRGRPVVFETGGRPIRPL